MDLERVVVIGASLAGVIALGLYALWRLLRPAHTRFTPWNPDAAAEYAALGTPAPAQADGVIWGESGRAAIVFRRTGRILLALGDPVGDPADRISAIWSLRDLAREENLDPAIWRATRQHLQTYGDIGLTALPLGPDGIPIGDSEDTPGPHATHFLVCLAERDLPALLPLLPGLARL